MSFAQRLAYHQTTLHVAKAGTNVLSVPAVKLCHPLRVKVQKPVLALKT